MELRERERVDAMTVGLVLLRSPERAIGKLGVSRLRIKFSLNTILLVTLASTTGHLGDEPLVMLATTETQRMMMRLLEIVKTLVSHHHRLWLVLSMLSKVTKRLAWCASPSQVEQANGGGMGEGGKSGVRNRRRKADPEGLW